MINQEEKESPWDCPDCGEVILYKRIECCPKCYWTPTLAALREKLAEAEMARDTYLNDAAHERGMREKAESRAGELAEALKSIKSVPTYRENSRQCRWCPANKAGFHYPQCPRAIAHAALSNTDPLAYRRSIEEPLLKQVGALREAAEGTKPQHSGLCCNPETLEVDRCDKMDKYCRLRIALDNTASTAQAHDARVRVEGKREGRIQAYELILGEAFGCSLPRQVRYWLEKRIQLAKAEREG